MYLGDFRPGDPIEFKFTTRDGGVPFTLAGSPVVSIYKANSTAQSTAGVTLTVDFDSISGLNHIHLTTSSDSTFYASGNDYQAVITAGTVNGYSVVGEVVKEFSIDNRGFVKCSRQAVAQSGSGSQVKLDASASSVTDFYKGSWIHILSGTGAGQGARTILTYNGASKTATLDRPWVTSLDSTSVFQVLPTDSPSVSASLAVLTASPRVIIISGTAQTGSTSNTIKLAAASSSTSNIYNNDLIATTGGTGAGQTRTIVSYNGATKVATVDRAWVVVPDNTTTYDVYANIAPSVFSDQGVVQAATSGTVTLASTASSVDNVYNGSLLTILSGTDAGDTVEIASYDGTTKVATIVGTFAVTPDTTSVYAVIPTQSGSGNTGGTQDVNVINWAGEAVNSLDGERGAAADKLLGRSLAGGADGGRTVQDALRFSRNRWKRDLASGTLTVYMEDDTTVAWTSAITLSAVNPVTESDPS